ncbi:hypothetical protein CRG98_047667 [Punica granatum]|uniref:Uncharacterized protein n=1 Tax=Punica granatum TaxID=22663 RepID=A0A2I0HJR1_PUNGR|nr:hypothetical protein CRG98_047667 [Punica granatum]
MSCPPRYIKWRWTFFRGLNLSPFEIIDHAIEVVKVDCPREFDAQKLGIAERLFLSRVVGGTVNKNVCNHRIDDYPLGGTEEGEIEIMEDSSIGVVKILNKKSEDRRDVVRTFNDANNNKHHPESKEEIIRETPRIKTILDNHRTEDQTVLDALMKLHSMNNMTVEILRMDGNSNVNMGSDDPPTEEEKCQGGLFHEAAGPFVSSAPMDRGRYSAKDRLLLKPEDIKVLGKVNPEAVEDEEEEPSIVQCRRPVAPVDSVAFMDVSSLTSPMASEMSTASGVKDALVVDKPGVKKMPRLNAKGILGPAPIAQTRLETPNKRATVFEVPSVPGYDVNLVDKTPRQDQEIAAQEKFEATKTRVRSIREGKKNDGKDTMRGIFLTSSAKGNMDMFS